MTFSEKLSPGTHCVLGLLQECLLIDPLWELRQKNAWFLDLNQAGNTQTRDVLQTYSEI